MNCFSCLRVTEIKDEYLIKTPNSNHHLLLKIVLMKWACDDNSPIKGYKEYLLFEQDIKLPLVNPTFETKNQNPK
jgi:hypothetical protein